MRTKSSVPPPANFVSDHITELIMITYEPTEIENKNHVAWLSKVSVMDDLRRGE